MTSADNTRYVTVEMFREGIAEIKTELREMKGEIRVLEREVAVNSTKIEMLQHTFYWGLAIIAVAATLAPIFKRETRGIRQRRRACARGDDDGQPDSAQSFHFLVGSW